MAGVDAKPGTGQSTAEAQANEKPTGRVFTKEMTLVGGGKVTVVFPESLQADFPGGREINPITTSTPQ